VRNFALLLKRKAGRHLDTEVPNAIHPAGNLGNADAVFFVLDDHFAPGDQRVVCQDIQRVPLQF